MELKTDRKTFLKYLVPSVASLIMFSFYSMVDGIFVSRTAGEFALSAVNIAFPFINALFALSMLFAMGASTLVSHALGRNDKLEASRIFTQNVYVLVAVSLVITALTEIFTVPLARFLGATDNTFDMVVTYLRISAPFTMFFMLGYALELLVKTGGHPQVAFTGILICTVTNIAIAYVLVMVLHMGVAGAAISMGAAQFVSALIFFLHFARGKSAISFVKIKKPFLGIYKKLIPAGLSDFSNEVSLAVVVLIFNRVAYDVMGEDGVVCYAVLQYINNMVMVSFGGITQGMQPLVGLAYGAKDARAEAKFLRMGYVSALILSVASFIVCFFFPEAMTSLILDRSVAAFPEAVRALRLFSISFLMAGYNICSAGFFNATSSPSRALTLSIGRGFALIAAAIFTLSALFGADGLWLSPVVSEGIVLLVNIVLMSFYLKKRLAKNRAPLA